MFGNSAFSVIKKTITTESLWAITDILELKITAPLKLESTVTVQ
jgi:hypothetical protein